jgi:hypothetical protein
MTPSSPAATSSAPDGVEITACRCSPTDPIVQGFPFEEVIVTVALPVAPPNVAVTVTTVPVASEIRRPWSPVAVLKVAVAVLDKLHPAWLVRSSVVPLE